MQPLLQWKSNKFYIFWVCVCSRMYPACNAHAPCHLRPAPLYSIFPNYLVNGTNFGRTLLNTNVFWLSVRLLSEAFLIRRRTERDVIQNVRQSACEVPVILVRVQWNLNFLARFSKNTQISHLMKICSLGTELFHADGRTDGQTWRS